jgi:hypothetical protein
MTGQICLKLILTTGLCDEPAMRKEVRCAGSQTKGDSYQRDQQTNNKGDRKEQKVW